MIDPTNTQWVIGELGQTALDAIGAAVRDTRADLATYRSRLPGIAARHTQRGMVSSYPTDAFLAFASQDPPQLIQEVRLIGGYRWDRATREIGTAVLSARDGASNVLWVVELAEGAADEGVSHFEPRVPDGSLPPLPTIVESLEIEKGTGPA